jgi:hypothetical protein
MVIVNIIFMKSIVYSSPEAKKTPRSPPSIKLLHLSAKLKRRKENYHNNNSKFERFAQCKQNRLLKLYQALKFN